MLDNYTKQQSYPLVHFFYVRLTNVLIFKQGFTNAHILLRNYNNIKKQLENK